MKAKIVKKEYYVAKTDDGQEYYVDINDDVIKEAYKSKKQLDGTIIEEEVQHVFDDGSFDRSYSVIEKFTPIVK